MHAAIDVKRLMPVWDQFRADTDVGPIGDEDRGSRAPFLNSPSQDRRGCLGRQSIVEQFLDPLNEVIKDRSTALRHYAGLPDGTIAVSQPGLPTSPLTPSPSLL